MTRRHAGLRACEVGDGVRAAFVDRDPGVAAAFTATCQGHWLCDFCGLARRGFYPVSADGLVMA